MPRKKGSLGEKTLIKFYEMHKSGEKISKDILKQIKDRGIALLVDGEKNKKVVVKETKKTIKRKAKITPKNANKASAQKRTSKAKKNKKSVKPIGSPNAEKTIWKEHEKSFRFQVDGCTKTEAIKFAKSVDARIAAVAYFGSEARKTYVFKKEFADMADAKRWAKKNKFKFIKG